MLRGMHARHRGGAGGQLRLQVHARAAEELRLPRRDVLEADALGHVLAAQDRGRGGDGLRPVLQEVWVDGRELNEVVGQAEALLSPARLPQVPPQEGVGRWLVHPEAEGPLDLQRRLAHVVGAADAVSDESEPGGQLEVLFGAALPVEARRGQGARHADQLQLGPLHTPGREVGVDVAEGSEEHVLGVCLSVQRHGCVAAGVDLRDPVEQDCSHPASRGCLPWRGGGLGRVKLQEHLAPGGRKQRALAHAAELVAPEIQLLQRRVGGKSRRDGLRADVPDAVVPQGQPPDRGTSTKHGGYCHRADIADAVAPKTELSDRRLLRPCKRPCKRAGAGVTKANTAQFLVWLQGRGVTPLEVLRCPAGEAHARTVSKRRQQVHHALQDLARQVLQLQPRAFHGACGRVAGQGDRPREPEAHRILHDPSHASGRWWRPVWPGAERGAGPGARCVREPRAAAPRRAQRGPCRWPWRGETRGRNAAFRCTRSSRRS
mmetsp:Transcript_62450/g.177360  ORF Transcript_62450/g.177360 Transcript_62450/m.177360 type:complete len:489 (+) Transcript_62450:333-1799(+)